MNLYLVQYRKDGDEEQFAVYVVADDMEKALFKVKTQTYYQSGMDFVDVSFESPYVIV